MEGCGDHRGGQDTLDGYRSGPVAVSLRIQESPFAGRDGDLGELFAVRTVVVEVPLRGHGIQGQGAEHAVGGLVLGGGRMGLDHSAEAAGCRRALVGAVRDQRHVAPPRADGVYGRPHHELEGRAPSIVEETQAGCKPQYSAMAAVLNRSTPVVARPSTSAMRRPASSRAARDAWVWSW